MTVAGSAAEPAPPQRTILLRRNALYELQSLWGHGEEPAGLDAWMERSANWLSARGAKPLLAVTARKALFGDYLPTRFRVVEWPDTAAYEAARQAAGEMALDNLGGDVVAAATVTLARLHPEIHAYPDEFAIELDERLCYEVSAFWDRADAPRSCWEEFITAVTPSIGAHGGHPLLVFQPLRCERGDFLPTRVCIAAWDSQAHFESFVAAPEHAEISRLRWPLAVARMDATATCLLP